MTTTNPPCEIPVADPRLEVSAFDLVAGAFLTGLQLDVVLERDGKIVWRWLDTPALHGTSVEVVARRALQSASPEDRRGASAIATRYLRAYQSETHRRARQGPNASAVVAYGEDEVAEMSPEDVTAESFSIAAALATGRVRSDAGAALK